MIRGGPWRGGGRRSGGKVKRDWLARSANVWCICAYTNWSNGLLIYVINVIQLSRCATDYAIKFISP